MSPENKGSDILKAIRERIIQGEFGTGGRLPSLRMFASHYKTTQQTMNAVIQRLQAEGFLISLGKRGVFVHTPHSRVPTQTPQFDLPKGVHVRERVIARFPTEEECEQLKINRYTPLLEVQRTTSTNEESPIPQRPLIFIASDVELVYEYDV